MDAGSPTTLGKRFGPASRSSPKSSKRPGMSAGTASRTVTWARVNGTPRSTCCGQTLPRSVEISCATRASADLSSAYRDSPAAGALTLSNASSRRIAHGLLNKLAVLELIHRYHARGCVAVPVERDRPRDAGGLHALHRRNDRRSGAVVHRRVT